MKEHNIQIGFFPLGSTISFKAHLATRHNGKSEYRKMVMVLTRNQSVGNVLLLQKSDWSLLSESEKLEIDPFNKIVDVYKQSAINTSKIISENSKTELERLYDYIKEQNIHIDAFVSFLSQGYTNNNLIEFKIRKDGNGYARAQQMNIAYAGPCVNVINSIPHIPLFLCATDPRYVSGSKKQNDTCNAAECLLSQLEGNLKLTLLETYDSYSPFRTVNVPIRYSGIEGLNICFENIKENTGTTLFSVVAMESKYRGKEIKKYILDSDIDDIHIYGKWDEEWYQYKEFKGMRTPDEIDNILSSTKYTLIIPIEKAWATSKYLEVIMCGTIPFIHPDYDSQFNIFPKDHFLRINSKSELFQKIKYLEENPEHESRLRTELKNLFLEKQQMKDLFKTMNAYLEKYAIKLDESYVNEFKKSSILKSIKLF